MRPVLSEWPTDRELFRARVFEEPFIPVGRSATEPENRALAGAIQAYVEGARPKDYSAFEHFLDAEDASPWRASVLLGLGLAYLRVGRFTRAARCWQEAWDLAKGQPDGRARAVADRALGELANLRASFAQLTEVEALLAEAKGRPTEGQATERLRAAQTQVALRAEHPLLIRPTGVRAIERILALRDPAFRGDRRLDGFKAPRYGMSLAQVASLANDLGLGLRLARHADKDAAIPVPSIVHLELGHYATVTATDSVAGRKYRLEDPAFGAMWIDHQALTEEASGYYLVPAADASAGWRPVDRADAERVLGRCIFDARAEDTTPDDHKEGDCCSERGMPTYRFHSLTANLNITDTPVGYTPARGPAVNFTLTYNHKEATQPQIFTFSNLGPRWTFDHRSYIEDQDLAALKLHIRGGGVAKFSAFDGTAYPPDPKSRVVVTRVSEAPIRWEARYPDGAVDVYAQPDCDLCSSRRVFITESRDPGGVAIRYTYDEDVRLVAITDALEQVTRLAYESPLDPLKISAVTDPFGRVATFEYDESGKLVRITDMAGMASEFQYVDEERTDFIGVMRTPYGTTVFRQYESPTKQSLQATDPLGGIQRIEYSYTSADGYVTRFWDKHAMATAPADPNLAKTIKWLESPRSVTGVKASEKQPLQAKVRYAHDGAVPMMRRPTRVFREMEDGTTQVHRYEYNERGNTIWEADPRGRTTQYTYADDGIDLLEVRRRVTGQDPELLARYTYDDAHRQTSTTDAAGQTTHYTYTANGQIATIVTPACQGLSEAERTTRYEYYPAGHPVAPERLRSVTGPGGTTSYTYDVMGRLQTTTDPEGYTLTYEYDVLDRPTRTLYPDGTYEETTYDRLDAVARRDRQGRWSYTYYDAVRRVVGTMDAAGRTVRHEYTGSGTCSACGGGSAMTALVDANGNRTRWEHDPQGRAIKEIRANEAAYLYGYDPATGRLRTVTDPKGNVRTTTYNTDGTVAAIRYTLGADTQPTADVEFSYDVHGRLEMVTDGSGTTRYSYYPVSDPPTLGAGKLRSVDGPLDADTIEYGYDELGRIVSRQIGSAANIQTQAFDALGRLERLTNPLGTFTYTYEGLTGRPASLTYPNGQQTSWSYYGLPGDFRLREIHNKRPGGATLSRFEYTYDKAGNILTWLQQADSDPPKVYHLGYDAADQLTAAILRATDPQQTIVKRYYYAYDPAGNRTAEQIDDAVTGASYNNMNQLVSQQAGGALVFKGTVSEPASVTVGGKPATVTADNRFEGQTVVPGGTGQVAVAATDPSGNTRTSTYQVSQGATSKSFTYDLNGNMTSDGTRTYEWDAENRLVAAKTGEAFIANYTYRYDGIRSSKTAEGVTTMYVLEGDTVVEGRLSSGGTTKHFHGPGIDNALGVLNGGNAVTYLTRDHLGSIREHVDAVGSVILRRDYDSWGNMPTADGTEGSALTGREWDPETALYYYRARYYSAAWGRFLSEDLAGVDHLYAYVRNNPILHVDPSGLVDLNLIAGGDARNQLGKEGADNYSTGPAFFSVAAHSVRYRGSTEPFAFNDQVRKKFISPAELACLIKKEDKWKSGKVRKVLLLACNVGSGKRSLAQQLADILQVEVVGVVGGRVGYTPANADDAYGGWAPNFHDGAYYKCFAPGGRSCK